MNCIGMFVDMLYIFNKIMYDVLDVIKVLGMKLCVKNSVCGNVLMFCERCFKVID